MQGSSLVSQGPSFIDARRDCGTNDYYFVDMNVSRSSLGLISSVSMLLTDVILNVGRICRLEI